MARPFITSREYKVMLRARRFRGDEEALRRATMEFWREFRRTIGPFVINSGGDLDKIEKTRLIVFHDTADHLLYRNGYIFRERRGEAAGRREVTLKFRHPDGYLAQDRQMAPGGAGRGTTKFEEDIKLPFEILYSVSTSLKISANKNLNRLNDPGKLYPWLPKKLSQYDKTEVIRPVGNLVAKEVVMTGAEFQIDESPRVKAECALIVWYEVDRNTSEPAVVEFSYRYGDRKGNYSGDCARRAYDVFLTLQSKTLSNWVDAESRTKTAYVYSLGQAAQSVDPQRAKFSRGRHGAKLQT
jgi:hypothetical protein